MTHVLMLSMDATLFTGARGDSRARHVEYARRSGSLDVVVCARGQFAPIDDDRLRLRASQSRSRLFYLRDGYQLARKLVADCHPDVITSQDPFLTGLIGLRLRQTLGVPLIVQDHTSAIGSPLFLRESIMTRLLGLIARHVVRRADVVRVVNSHERETCIRLGIAPDRVYVIPAATDLSLFSQPDHRIDWRARLGIGETEKLVLWVGRPVPVKNLPLLLNTFAQVHARLPDARLVLAGNVTDTPIPALIETLGLQNVVKTPGAIAHGELPGLYQAADIYAHSSWYEGFGLVLVEAAAAGLPIVSTATDGARDIVRDGETGLLVAQEVEPFSEALIRLLSHPDEAKAMGGRARADVLARFDREKLIDQWVGLWQQTAQQFKRE